MIDWGTICQSKELEGLGIRQAENMNKAMLTRLLWRLLKEKNSSWACVLSKKNIILASYLTQRPIRQAMHLLSGRV